MDLNSGRVAYALTRKKMKNMRIRVTGDMRVMVSAPRQIPSARIDAFVQSHEGFIRNRLNEVEAMRSAHYPQRYLDGDMFSCLGTRLRLKICTAPLRSAVLANDTLTLYLPANAGREDVKALFSRWARAHAAQVFAQRLAVLLPRFSGASALRISVRSMITRWGSINVKRRTMSLSVHLLRCETSLIDYVITHELCHLAYPHHTKAFYAALEARCPERAQMDERLKSYGLVAF